MVASFKKCRKSVKKSYNVTYALRLIQVKETVEIP